MSGAMRAVRFYGKEDVRLDNVPVPSPGDGQVRLKPAFVGICGTGRLHDTNECEKSTADSHRCT
jgi:threonine dehydrogenase-like Zn-dependent dehydrogenase